MNNLIEKDGYILTSLLILSLRGLVIISSIFSFMMGERKGEWNVIEWRKDIIKDYKLIIKTQSSEIDKLRSESH